MNTQISLDGKALLVLASGFTMVAGLLFAAGWFTGIYFQAVMVPRLEQTGEPSQLAWLLDVLPPAVPPGTEPDQQQQPVRLAAKQPEPPAAQPAPQPAPPEPQAVQPAPATKPAPVAMAKAEPAPVQPKLESPPKPSPVQTPKPVRVAKAAPPPAPTKAAPKSPKKVEPAPAEPEPPRPDAAAAFWMGKTLGAADDGLCSPAEADSLMRPVSDLSPRGPRKL